MSWLSTGDRRFARPRRCLLAAQAPEMPDLPRAQEPPPANRNHGYVHGTRPHHPARAAWVLRRGHLPTRSAPERRPAAHRRTHKRRRSRPGAKAQPTRATEDEYDRQGAAVQRKRRLLHQCHAWHPSTARLGEHAPRRPYVAHRAVQTFVQLLALRPAKDDEPDWLH